MTIHNLKRRHLYWNETETNIRLLDELTELNIDEIEDIAALEESETLAIDKVLEASEKPFMQSLDAERRRTTVTLLEGDF